MNPQVELLMREIVDAQAEIKNIQDACSHPNVQKTPRADTGNYDPSVDLYWIECRCPDCDKHWDIDQ
jgi:hypothetical protein